MHMTKTDIMFICMSRLLQRFDQNMQCFPNKVGNANNIIIA